jgi:hypothetical protein
VVSFIGVGNRSTYFVFLYSCIALVTRAFMSLIAHLRLHNTHSLTHSLTHSPSLPPSPSLTHSLTHSLIRSLTHSFAHALTLYVCIFKGTISLDDFVLLLEDRAFVDYFNIFQSLPVSKLVHFL